MEKLGGEIEQIKNLFGIHELTPFQLESVKSILSGAETLIIGETGSGKTEAVVIPVFKLLKGKPSVACIYVTPLRALNRDIFERVVKAGDRWGIRVEVRHGDTSNYVRRQQLKDPPEMLITTPETLQILSVAPKFKELLKNVKFVILDEIHEYCGSKRGAQLSFMLQRMRKIADFKLIGMSATISDPNSVIKYFWGNKSPEIITNSKQKRKTVQVIPLMDFQSKVEKIIELSREKSTLIFVNTRPAAEKLTSDLKKITEIYVHHGSLSKERRRIVEKNFKEGVVHRVVATSSLELGIDIGHVEQVIHYGSPRRVDSFTQRLGRGGHWIDRVSIGYILCSRYEAPESGVIAKFTVEGKLEPVRLIHNPLDVLAHQLVGLALENDVVDVKDAFEIARRSGAFAGVKKEEFKDVLKTLHKLWLINLNDGRYHRRKRAWEYYYRNVSMMPEEKTYFLYDVDGRKVASLDSGFVEDLEPGETFIVGGETWQFIRKEGRKIYGARYPGGGQVATWTGDLIPVDRMVASEIPEAIKNPEKYFIKNENLIVSLGKYEKDKIYFNRFNKILVFLTFAGTRINNTLSTLAGIYLTLKKGKVVNVRSDHIGVAVEGEIPTDFFGKIDETRIEKTLRRYLPHLPVFRKRFLDVARRFGVIEKDADLTSFSTKKLISAWKGTPVYEETVREVLTDKFEIEGTAEFVREIKEGRITFSKERGDLGRLLVEKMYPQSVEPKKPSRAILDSVMKRLLSKKVNLYCFHCKTYLGTFTVASAPEKCPYCGAKEIGIVYNPKIMRKRDLSVEEKKQIERARMSASLFLSYGKKALIVLSGSGIGPKTAAKILQNSQNDREMLEKIIDAERIYARTKPFWS